MAQYAFSNQVGNSAAQSTTVVSVLSLTAITGAATLSQGCLIDVSFGQTGQPATTDGPVLWQINSCTSAGTPASTPVPNPTNPAWKPCGTICGVNFTTAGNSPTGFNTPAGILYAIPINQRASYRWMPVPGSELYWPKVTVNGLVISTSATSGSYTGFVQTSGTFTE